MSLPVRSLDPALPVRSGPSPRALRLLLIAGIAGISSASILIRWAGDQGSGAFTVAGWRMLYAALFLLAAATRRHRELWTAVRRHRGLYGAASVCLAVHFGAWTLSLYHIPVARSTVLVETQPIFVVLVSWLVLGERPRLATLGFISLALLGIAWMSRRLLGSPHLYGDLLALGGALFLGLYLLVSRRLRQRVDLALATGPTYLFTALLLLLAALIGEGSIAASPGAHGLFLALALVPTLGGHAVFQYALRYLPAPVIATSFLGEPPVAALLAWVAFREIPDPDTLLGGLVCLAGVAGVILGPAAAAGLTSRRRQNAKP